MISLCSDSELIYSVLNDFGNSKYIREYIKLYLDSYGTEFDFQDLFLQKDTETGNCTAVVLRYNSQIFALVSDDSDLQELFPFLSGFSQCTVVADKILKPYFSNSDVCCEMLRRGVVPVESSPQIKESNAPKEIADLVGESLSKDEKTDYYLNLSHQLRHNRVSAYACYLSNKPVSAVILSNTSQSTHLITTVYTKEYFRGNGYAKRILEHICCDPLIKYILLCEEHNLNFYNNCGFSVADTYIRFRL